MIMIRGTENFFHENVFQQSVRGTLSYFTALNKSAGYQQIEMGIELVKIIRANCLSHFYILYTNTRG